MLHDKEFRELEQWREDMKQAFHHLARYIESGEAKRHIDEAVASFAAGAQQLAASIESGAAKREIDEMVASFAAAMQHLGRLLGPPPGDIGTASLTSGSAGRCAKKGCRCKDIDNCTCEGHSHQIITE